MELYVVRTDALDQKLRAFFLRFAEEEKQKRILGLKKNQDAVLLGDILAKYAICKSFGISVPMQKIEYNAYGKPYLSGREGAHFNISHSGNYVICVTADIPVGADIQKISPVSDALLQKVCTRAEQAEIKTALSPMDAFCRIWTRKEAVAKCRGTGIFHNEEDTEKYSVETIPWEEYYISVAVERKNPIENVY